MLIYSIILLIIILLLCNSITYNSIYKCSSNNTTIDYVKASKFKENFDPNVIRVKFDQNIPCGVYSCSSTYGMSNLVVNHIDSTIGYLYNINIQTKMKDIDVIDLWNITKQNGKNNLTIQTFNNGCCK